jgi:hypothetical protein
MTANLIFICHLLIKFTIFNFDFLTNLKLICIFVKIYEIYHEKNFKFCPIIIGT